MKKLIVVAAIMMGFLSFTNAQQSQASPTGAKHMSPKGMMASSKAKPVVTKPAVTRQVVTTTSTAAKPAASAKVVSTTRPVKSTTVVLKKDGTPDKRYAAANANKGPVKKNGTLDMRYSKNKKAAKS